MGSQAVEDAIREGVIYWHAFPFNAQLELMDEDLLRSSVRLTHELDARFDQSPKLTLSQVGEISKQNSIRGFAVSQK